MRKGCVMGCAVLACCCGSAFAAMQYTSDANTVLLWNFDEPSGVITDASGNGHVSDSAIDRVAGKFGSAAAGSTWAQFGGKHGALVTGSFTAEAWIMAPSTWSGTGTSAIVGMQDYDSPWGHNVVFGVNDGRLWFGFYNGGAWCTGTSSDVIDVTDDWVHIACVYDMSRPQWNRAVYYVNGVEVLRGTDNLDGSPTGAGYLYMGKSGFGGGSYPLAVDEVRLSNIARSADAFSPNIVPEPMTLAVLAIGSAAMLRRRMQ